MREPVHGRYSNYSNRVCRCQVCKAAWAVYNDRKKHEREKAIPDHVHGKYTTYGNYRCRCALCTMAWRAARRSIRATGSMSNWRKFL